LARFEFESGTFPWIYLDPLHREENRVCLSHGVQVTGAARWVAMRIMAGVGDLVQRTGDGRTGQVLGGQTIGWSGDTVCGLHHA
jgi:hypothetical protein